MKHPDEHRLTKRATAAFATRVYLIALVLAVAAPALALTGYLLFRFADAERARVENHLREEAKNIVTVLDRRVSGMIEALELLALTHDFANEDMRQFYERAGRARKILGRNVVLRDLEGRQIVNPRAPWGEPLPIVLLPSDQAALEHDAPQISDVFKSPADGAPIVSVVIPIRIEDRPAYLLNLSHDLEFFAVLLRDVRLPKGRIGSLADSTGRVVARVRDGAPFEDRPDPTVGPGPEGAIVSHMSTGERVLVGWATSDFGDWRGMSIVPYALIDAPRREALGALVALGGAVLLVGAALAWVVGARISKALRALTQASIELGARRKAPVVRTPLSEVNEIGEALREAGARLEENEARLEKALAAAHMYAFEWSGESRAIVRSASSNLVLGETRNDMRDGLRGELVARIHPADQAMFQRALRGVAPDKPAYCVEYRYIRPDGETIWLQTSGVGEFGPSGQQLRVTGFTRDITARKQAEIRQSLLVRELHHRVKNNLATVLALANLSARNATSVEDYKTKLRARIHSMARSHALLNEAPFRTAYLRNVLQDELEPYAQGSIDRIRIEGPDVDLPAEAALALAMAVHELATNAGKYGALSTEKGRVDVRWERLEAQGRSRLRLHWRESGGPPVTPPARKGFGSRLLESVIGDQLKGRVQIDYRPEGLVVEIEASLDRIPVEAPIAAAG